MALFSTLLATSTDEVKLLSVVDVAVKTISGQSSNVDSRLFCYALIDKFKTGNALLSEKIIRALSAMTIKENNALVLTSCFSIMNRHIESITSKFASEFMHDFVLKGMGNSAKLSIMKGCFLLLWTGYSSKTTLDALGAENVEKVVKVAKKGVGFIKSSLSSLLDAKKDSPAFVMGYYAVGWMVKAAEWEVEAGNGNDIGLILALTG
jgi:hypothetical protein